MARSQFRTIIFEANSTSQSRIHSTIQIVQLIVGPMFFLFHFRIRIRQLKFTRHVCRLLRWIWIGVSIVGSHCERNGEWECNRRLFIKRVTRQIQDIHREKNEKFYRYWGWDAVRKKEIDPTSLRWWRKSDSDWHCPLLSVQLLVSVKHKER